MSVPWIRIVFVMLLSSSGNVSSILVPPYLHSLDYDYTSIGLLVAVTSIAQLCSRFPAGALYQPDRARRITMVCIVVMAVNYLLYPLAHNPASFALVQIIAGLANGVATTTNLAMFMDALPPDTPKHRPMAFYAGALAGGFTVGNLVGGLAGDFLGVTQAFVIASATTLSSLIFLWLDRPHLVRAAKAESKGEPLPLRERLSGTLAGFAEPRLVGISGVAFLLNFLHTIVNTFLPLYGIAIGLSLSEIGLLKSVHSLVNAVARPIASAPVRALGARRASLIGVVALAAMDTLVPLQGTFILLAIVLAGVGLMRAIALVGNTVELADIDHTRISRGMASSLYNSCQDVGSLSGPAICGALASVIGLTSMMTIVPLGSTALFLVVLFGVFRKAHREPVVVATR
jgi:predicted MFS family arabinose efflux permease